ncbi:hypothetical protein JHK82_034250 [Glycine max]|nr:hypothetical protein JHK82_034250 [Glycine max]
MRPPPESNPLYPAQESLFWPAEASSSHQTGPTRFSYPTSGLGAYGVATTAPSTSAGTGVTPPVTMTVPLLQHHWRKPTSNPGEVDPGRELGGWLQPTYLHHPIQGIRKMQLRGEGVGALWTGIGPYIARNGIINVVELGSYDQVKQVMKKTLDCIVE